MLSRSEDECLVETFAEYHFDDFLEYQLEDYGQVGKLAIAYVLLSKQRQEDLHSAHGDWTHHLLGA